MKILRIITLLVILFVIILIVLPFVNNSGIFSNIGKSINSHNVIKDINSIKDTNTIKDTNLVTNIKNKTNDLKDKPIGFINNLKNKINYGNPDRNLSINSYFCPENDCEYNLVQLINSSKSSIDCAVYDINLKDVADALIAAKNRGLSVNFVTDYDRSGSIYSKVGYLKYNKINVLVSPSDSSYMHNKFCVFDNKTVWLGSMNFTLNGTYKNNNNVLVINDKQLAQEYTNKINSFYENKFSMPIDKNITINRIGNLQNYFCPEDNCEYHVSKQIDDANISIDCMFFSFTLDDITNELETKNISKRFIFESRTVNEYSEYNKLKEMGVLVLLDKNPNSMHNKFCVIDGKILMTGSANLSNNGMKNNDEDLVFVNDFNLAQNYLNYFNKYWKEWNN